MVCGPGVPDVHANPSNLLQGDVFHFFFKKQKNIFLDIDFFKINFSKTAFLQEIVSSDVYNLQNIQILDKIHF